MTYLPGNQFSIISLLFPIFVLQQQVTKQKKSRNYIFLNFSKYKIRDCVIVLGFCILGHKYAYNDILFIAIAMNSREQCKIIGLLEILHLPSISFFLKKH